MTGREFAVACVAAAGVTVLVALGGYGFLAWCIERTIGSLVLGVLRLTLGGHP